MKRVNNTLKGLEDIRKDLLYKSHKDILEQIFIIDLIRDIKSVEQRICEAYNLTK